MIGRTNAGGGLTEKAAVKILGGAYEVITYTGAKSGTATLKDVSVFPCFIGCKQFNSPKYPARPLYAIYNNSSYAQLDIMLQRNYYEDRELLTIEDATNAEGDSISTASLDLRMQSIAHDGNFWMDKGAFRLKIQEN